MPARGQTPDWGLTQKVVFSCPPCPSSRPASRQTFHPARWPPLRLSRRRTGLETPFPFAEGRVRGPASLRGTQATWRHYDRMWRLRCQTCGALGPTARAKAFPSPSARGPPRQSIFSPPRDLQKKFPSSCAASGGPPRARPSTVHPCPNPNPQPVRHRSSPSASKPLCHEM